MAGCQVMVAKLRTRSQPFDIGPEGGESRDGTPAAVADHEPVAGEIARQQHGRRTASLAAEIQARLRGLKPGLAPRYPQG